MKVNIGPYKGWVGPYQLAEIILFWKDKETDDCVHDFGTWLSNTFINDVCKWIDNKRQRRVKIHIDKYDTWNMDATLGLIILPMLQQLKATKHGSPHVDCSDVPGHLRTYREPSWDVDDSYHTPWEWILDEMIWAFEQIVNEASDDKFFDHTQTPMYYDHVGHKEYSDRILRGTTFFGKYYRGLWD